MPEDEIKRNGRLDHDGMAGGEGRKPAWRNGFKMAFCEQLREGGS